ncbi:MAG: O-antigen ligase family protein [Burkholderiaceae bacterium]
MAFGAGVLLVVLAPLIRGGNRGVALIGLEWLALLVLAGVQGGLREAWDSGWRRWALALLMTSPLWLGALHLVPLPPGWWAALPGRSPYAGMLDSLGLAGGAWQPLSLTPDATWASVLAGIPVLACLWLGLAAGQRQLHWLLRLWLLGALLQALLGLAQLGPFPALHAGSLFKGVIGTFANSNHLASFLAMCLPLVVWQWRRSVDVQGNHEPNRDARGWLWAVVGFVLLLAVLAGQSRAGLGTALLATAGAVLLMPGSALRRWTLRWRVGVLALALLGGLATVGTEGLRRFEGQTLESDASMRQQNFAATARAAAAFWPAGSGMGSFAAVFPRFQPAVAEGGFVEHAHSDYVQLLMEGGLPTALLMALALALLVTRALQLAGRLAQGRLQADEQRALAAGFGLLALLLHAWVDFNLRIPALAMLGAFLAGIFLRPLPPAAHMSARQARTGRRP